MWDANQCWQSDRFKAMLIYERNNDREKFIYDVNQMLNAYNDINRNFNYLIGNDDPQLLALIFYLISITYNKDDLSDYIKNEDLSNYNINYFLITLLQFIVIILKILWLLLKNNVTFINHLNLVILVVMFL